MKTTLEILENEIHWKINSVQEGEDYDGRIHYVMALEGVLRQIKGLKDEEKRLIVNAFEHVDFNLDDGQHYFEQTFKKTEQ
jgi:hypothetical protein